MENYSFGLLAEFNRKANNLMNDVIKTLTEEQWKRQFSGFYKSIQEICSHIYFCDYIGLNRFRHLKNFICLDQESHYKKYLDLYSIKISEDGNEYLDKNFTSWKNIFPDSSINEYIKMRIYLDDLIIKFIEEITTDDLEKIIKFTTVTGNKYEKRIEGLIVDLFTHQIHHRGMISLYLDMLGKENEFNDVFYII
jgi:uncharacterized damage-inducible protein DinB